MFSRGFCLVPEKFADPARERDLLAEVATLGPKDKVHSFRIPEFGAVAVYSFSEEEDKGELPRQIWMLQSLASDTENYNRIIAAVDGGRLYLVMAQGRSLLLCSNYSCSDFTTAQYYIFAAMKKFQLNPQVSTVRFCTPLSDEEIQSLCNYFRKVDVF
ncbi:MAG: DUF3822 family protein [Bacteroidales bacterium]|nr:DUF3822 family protein [Bacteroidales bacterium]